MSTSSRPLHFTRLFILAAAAIAASWVHPGHADAPQGRYVADKDTVLDTKTMLVWERNPSITPGIWMAAQTRCQMLILNGTDWRVPSMKELQTIVDRSGVVPTIDPTAFPTASSGLFWTSSSVADSPDSAAWAIKFDDGYTTSRSKTTSAYTRCVR